MKILIVEDNRSAVNVLKTFLDDFPLEIEVCAVAQNLEEAIEMTKTHQPDIFLLDIRINDQLIFSLFKRLDKQFFLQSEIIFTTAFYEAEYIHKALQHSALDYIVKPIDKEKLFEVLNKAIENLSSTTLESRIKNLERQMKFLKEETKTVQKIPFTCMNGNIEYIDSDQWVRIFTLDSITRVEFSDGDIKATPKPLKYFEETLDKNGPFFRISKQVIIHLEHLEKFNPGTKMASLRNGQKVKVSRRRSGSLLKRIEKSG